MVAVTQTLLKSNLVDFSNLDYHWKQQKWSQQQDPWTMKTAVWDKTKRTVSIADEWSKLDMDKATL